MDDLYAPHRSLASVIAIGCAIASFVVHSGAAGLALAIVAIVFGVIGLMLAMLPGTKGGCLSVSAMGLGVAGAICGIIRAVWHFGHL
ncbi:MAG: hypothetical protein JWL69_192 [Phycisphaerales bacterium]|jgi:hypothetical protein|nr:hypothetical protein [Phycisphaerales bacterium]MDB5357660.1 hypothetical protein [Phycisphaerales bacterium]